MQTKGWSLPQVVPYVAGWHGKCSAVDGIDTIHLHKDFPASSHGLPSSKQVKSVWFVKLWGWVKVPEVHFREILLAFSFLSSFALSNVDLNLYTAQDTDFTVFAYFPLCWKKTSSNASNNKSNSFPSCIQGNNLPWVQWEQHLVLWLCVGKRKVQWQNK